MAVFDNNFKEILLSQLVSVSGGLIAGIFLAININKILLIPGMLILIPGFLELRGNINGSLASRLSSGLFLKIINPKKYRTRIISGNLIASFILTLLIALILGIIAYLFTYLLFETHAPQIILIALIAVVIANLIELPLTIFATFYFFKKGHDPNNIMGPFITSVGDVVGIIGLLIALLIV